MNRRTLVALALPATLLLVTLASAAPAFADTNVIPDTHSLPNPSGIFTALTGQAAQIESTIQTFANWLFLALATLDLFWTVAQALLGGRSDVVELMVAVTQKFIVFNIVYWVFVVNGFSIVVGIINQFDSLGKTTEAAITFGSFNGLPAPGAAPTDPIAIFAQGIVYALPAIAAVIGLGAIPDIFVGIGFTNLWSGIINLETINVALIVGSYTFLAGTLALALFEAYVVTAAGIFVTGFLGSRWTSSLGEKYFSYALSVGVKLLMVYICIGLMQPLGPFVQATAAVPILGGFVALAAAIIAHSAPQFAASIISGSSNSSFGQFSGMLTNLASTSLKSVSSAIDGFAQAGQEAAMTAVGVGALAATGGAAAPALAGGGELAAVPQTALGSGGSGGSGGMTKALSGSGWGQGSSGSGGGMDALGSGGGMGDLLSVLPEQDAGSKAVSSTFDGVANISDAISQWTPQEHGAQTGAVAIRISV